MLMRSCFHSLIALLLSLLLLYGGLNLAEQNLSDLMALEHEAAAFAIRRQACGAVTLTFGGSAYTFSAVQLKALLESWRQRLRLISHEL